VITGDVRNKVDRVWDAFWTGGISNPLEVIEQITYLLSSNVSMSDSCWPNAARCGQVRR